MRRTGTSVPWGLAVLAALALCGCARERDPEAPRPQQAGQPMDPVRTAARIAAIHGAAAVGDQDAVRSQLEGMNEDFRRSIRLADPSRPVDREAARMAARRVEGVRTVAWIDRENLLAIVGRNEQRSQATIDAICLQLAPLGDTLGVVVNLQSGAATNGDDLEILSRNCQLAPGERAMLQRHRQVDVIPPALREQQRLERQWAEANAEELRRRQEASMRIVERTTPEF
ncbi:hypothetical protein LDO32_00690 [Luteimonas sp. Y-2-2-4F]|nr:hypothetical protein [Luteimonas sp. Y-2-2-4F]MCD9030253.1 hypothetical protein [Luteimonas sp. Y-2-2-4F]